MILPYITAIMKDVFSMVPPALKESAYGMGATSWEVTRKITIPFGMSGLLGSIFLSLGRALGETMAVTFVIGNSHRFATTLFKEGNTISSTLANEFGEADTALFMGVLMALGLILFVMSLIVQIASWYLLNTIAKSKGVKHDPETPHLPHYRGPHGAPVFHFGRHVRDLPPLRDHQGRGREGALCH